jgi:hypothetical protein
MSALDAELYGEFKGNTSAKLESIFNEIRGLRQDVSSLKTQVNNLNEWRAMTIGIGTILGALAGFFSGILKNYIHFNQ